MKEKLQEYALIAEIIGGIGIIGSLFFVGFQISQNNELMAAESRFNRLQIATGSSTLIAENPQLAEILGVVNTGERELTTAEQLQFISLQRRIFRNMEWTYLELPEDKVPLAEWKALFEQNTWQLSWNLLRGTLNQDFVMYIENNIQIYKK